MKLSTPADTRRSLSRAIRYLGRYRRDAALAYGALLIATTSQLMVPLLIERIIDTVTEGVAARAAAALPQALRLAVAERLGTTLEQLARNGETAAQALLITGGLVVLFAATRGLFAFSQAYLGERARRASPSICATNSSPGSSGCRSLITIAVRPGN